MDIMTANIDEREHRSCTAIPQHAFIPEPHSFPVYCLPTTNECTTNGINVSANFPQIAQHASDT